MARGRMLSQSIALDLEFNKMSMEAQFIFMRTIPHLDRDGLVMGNPVALWAKVAPLLPDLMLKTESVVQEWVAANLVISYDSPYGPVLYFKGFSKNQINMHYDRETESPFPPPPGYRRGRKGLEPDSPNNDNNHKPPKIPPSPLEPEARQNGYHETTSEEKSVERGQESITDGLRQDSGKTPARLLPNRS